MTEAVLNRLLGPGLDAKALAGLDRDELLALVDRSLSRSSRIVLARALHSLQETSAASAVLRAQPLDSYNRNHWPLIGMIAAAAGSDAATDALLERYWREAPPKLLTAFEAGMLSRWIVASEHPLPVRARWLRVVVEAEAGHPDRDGRWTPMRLPVAAEVIAALTASELAELAAAPLAPLGRMRVARGLAKFDEAAAAQALRALSLADYPEVLWPEIGVLLSRAGPAPDADALLERYWPGVDPTSLAHPQLLRLAEWVRLSSLPTATRILRTVTLQRAVPTGPDGRPRWKLRSPKLANADLAEMDRATLCAFAQAELDAHHRLVVAQFLQSLGRHRTAREVLCELAADDYPREVLPRVGAIVAGTEMALQIDGLLHDFVATMEREPPGSRIAASTIKWISRSGLDTAARLDLLDRLSRIVPIDEVLPGSWQVTVRRAEFELRRADNQLVDVLDYVPKGPLEPKDARLYVDYIQNLRLEGHEERALDFIRALRDPEMPDDGTWLIQMLLNFPTLVGIDQVALLLDRAEFRLQLLDALVPLRALGADYASLLDRVVADLVGDFVQASIGERNKILNKLLSHGYLEAARGAVALAGQVNDLLLPVHILDGWRWFEAEDYPRAHQAFRSVLEENPTNVHAMSGFRLTAVRSGKGFGAAIELRAKADTPSIPSHKGIKEQIWDLRVRGELSQAALVSTVAPPWALLLNLFGNRFLTDQDLGRLDPGGEVFIIASGGVGDEIRIAKMYDRIAERFRKVTATCDPRLVGLLSRSFPAIELIPCWRSRYGLTDRLNKMSGRKKGWNGLFYNILIEEAGARLAGADYIICPSYLQFLDAKTPLRETIAGRGYLVPPSGLRPPLPAVAGAPMRVGLLWRSDLLVKERRHLYLPHEALEGLLGIPGVELHAIQHNLLPGERAFCEAHGIVVRDDIDLFDDFEGMSDYLATLDLAIGISSVPTELAAALGVPVWFLGFSPENYFLRTVGGRTEIDQSTVNARIVSAPDIDFTEPAGVCIGKTIREARRRLSIAVAASSHI